MDKERKIIQPLNNNIEIEQNRSFAPKNIQQAAVQAQNQNTPETYKTHLAEETRDILREQQNHQIKESIRKMRKNVLKLSFVFILFFFVYFSQGSNYALVCIFFLVLQIPYYFSRKKWIIKDYKDSREFQL